MINIELSDSLQRDLTEMMGHNVKDDVRERHLKFDDRGTLHVLGYDEEGKRIDDLAVRETKFHAVERAFSTESFEEAKAKTAQTKQVATIANVLLIVVGIITLGCLYVVSQF